MGYQVIFASQAIERLEEIVRYIAQDNPSAAETFGLRLVDHTGLLADRTSPVGRRTVLRAKHVDVAGAPLQFRLQFPEAIHHVTKLLRSTVAVTATCVRWATNRI